MTSFCVTSFYHSVGNLTPTLVHNFTFNSMDLLMRILFRVIFDHKRERYNQISVREFDYYTSTFFERGLVRVSNRPYVARDVMVQYLIDLYDCMSVSCYNG